MSRARTEEELGEQCLQYLRSRGWRCYSEVEVIYGRCTDIVAIRDRRVAFIELKLMVREKLVEQVSKHRGLCYSNPGCFVVGMCTNPIHSEQTDSINLYGRCMALRDEQLWYCGRRSWRDPNEIPWTAVPDLIAPARSPESIREAFVQVHPKPASLQFLKFFEGYEENDGAGSSGGSKGISLFSLAMNWTARNYERLNGLSGDELHAVVSRYIGPMPDSYGYYLAGAVKNPTPMLSMNMQQQHAWFGEGLK